MGRSTEEWELRAVPALMTVPEAAQLLRMNPKALYALAAAGKVPGVLRLGRSIRIRRAALVGAGAVDSVPVEAQRLTGEQP